MLSAAVLLSFAWHSRYTHEFLDFTQHCSNGLLMHSNNAWDSVHAFCSNSAQLLLGTLGTPMSFWFSHSTAVTQGLCTATMSRTLCLHRSCSKTQGGNSLCCDSKLRLWDSAVPAALLCFNSLALLSCLWLCAYACTRAARNPGWKLPCLWQHLHLSRSAVEAALL